MGLWLRGITVGLDGSLCVGQSNPFGWKELAGHENDAAATDHYGPTDGEVYRMRWNAEGKLDKVDTIPLIGSGQVNHL